ncbi:hypothetical protein QYF36_003903 [Acer negundo]|nr:hypothetical protein QYF36_003903 [Acer negundo]
MTETYHDQEWLAIKIKYEEMKNRIESATAQERISREIRDQHKGFLEWNDKVTKQNHQSIVQIIIDGRDTKAVDKEGCQLPTLVYMAREKRPEWPHNFKAGAMNSLIRVSSEIRHEIAFVQHPQTFNNITQNDLYSNNNHVVSQVELAGIGGYYAALYCGTGCFHRRDSLSVMRRTLNGAKRWDWYMVVQLKIL